MTDNDVKGPEIGKVPLRLIQDAGGMETFYNPLLVALVENGKDPTTVARYAESLGWNGKIVARLRHAAQLYRDSKSYWASLVKSDVRPADVMLKFNKEPSFFLAQPGVEMSSHFCIAGDEFPLSSPALLRDFRVQTHSVVYTSLDGTGMSGFHDTELWRYVGVMSWCPEVLVSKGGVEFGINVATNSSNHCTFFRVGDLEIFTKPVRLRPHGAKFPLFYKLVRMSMGKERITVKKRIEFGHGEGSYDGHWPHMSSLVYEKIFNLGSAADLRLTVPFELDDRRMVVYRDDHDRLDQEPGFIQARFKHEVTNRSGLFLDQKAFARDSTALAEAAESFYRTEAKSVSLESILGQEMLQHPPKCLADLLI